MGPEALHSPHTHSRLVPLALVMLVAILLLPSPLALGDVVELKDGQRIEGEILRESSSLVSIKNKEGKILTFVRSQVEKVEKSLSLEERYELRRKELKDDDGAGHLALALWCKAEGLDEKAVHHFEKVIAVDPQNPEARKALGYILIDGKWYIEGSQEAKEAQAKWEEEGGRRKDPPVPPDTTGGTKGDPGSGGGETGSGGKDPAPREEKPTPRTAGTPMVFVEMKEVVAGKSPETSQATQRLNSFFSSLKSPLRIASKATEKKDGDLALDVKIDVLDKGTHRFYGKLELFRTYEGLATFHLKDAKTGTTLCRLEQVREQFTVGMQRDPKEAIDDAYGVTLQRLFHNLSKHPYFAQRGAPEIAPPSERE